MSIYLHVQYLIYSISRPLGTKTDRALSWEATCKVLFEEAWSEPAEINFVGGRGSRDLSLWGLFVPPPLM
jgi:hypothetical protein